MWGLMKRGQGEVEANAVTARLGHRRGRPTAGAGGAHELAPCRCRATCERAVAPAGVPKPDHDRDGCLLRFCSHFEEANDERFCDPAATGLPGAAARAPTRADEQ